MPRSMFNRSFEPRRVILKDETRIMERVLRLAERGRGRTGPNPMVGAVIVRGGRTVGEGFYTYKGKKHAEIKALEKAGGRARGGVLYVNLEPCCHHGRTPPCTDAIIEAGIKEVVLSIKDPDPRVKGKGMKILERSGIPVSVDLLSKEAAELNRAYIKHKKTGLPYVVLKTGMSLDARTATCSGQSKWITSRSSLSHYRRLRAFYDAVMVGVGTILEDDPSLDPRGRGIPKRKILKVILDSKLRIPYDARVLKKRSGLFIYTLKGKGARGKKKRLGALGAVIREVEGRERVDIEKVMRDLGANGVTSLIVEGGSKVAGACLGAGLVDGVLFYVAPLLMGGTGSLPLLDWSCGPELSGAVRVENMKAGKVGRDLLITGDIARKGRTCLRA